MTIKPLAAGSGYKYLTDQVARHDATRTTDGAPGLRGPAKKLGDYYTGTGNPAGRWAGRGAAALGLSGEVSEAQMESLFAHGKHPNYQEQYKTLWNRLLDEYGGHEKYTPELSRRLQRETDRALTLGRPYRKYRTVDERVADRVAELETAGRPVTAETREAIEVEEKAKGERQAIAGYDLTFSPVKSVSVVWALGDAATRMAVESAHHAAVAAAITWLEDEVAGARDGTNGTAWREVEGLIVTAFDHRTSRALQPDLHTHAVVANKVFAKPLAGMPGKWLALDGTTLFRATVAASELYNTYLEDELRRQLGVEFGTRLGTGLDGKRVIREIDGVPVELIEEFSARRQQIERAYDILIADYHREHGHYPDKPTQYKLAQQATLASRPSKKATTTEMSERAEWWRVATDVLGESPRAMLASALGRTVAAAEVTPEEIRKLGREVIAVVGDRRSTWTIRHLQAEAQRATRHLHAATEQDRAALVEQVVRDAVAGSLLLTPPDLVPVPIELIRGMDGRRTPVPAAPAAAPQVVIPAPRAPEPDPHPAPEPMQQPVAPSPETLRLYAANAAAAAWFRGHLEHRPRAQEYLSSRGIAAASGPGEPWALGYAPQSWTGLLDHLRRAGFTDTELLAAGLATVTRRTTLIDAFRDRLVFPIRDGHGIIGFTARDLSGAADLPKYKNTAATAIFDKSASLFGLAEQFQVEGPQKVLLVEGTADVLAVARLNDVDQLTGRVAAVAPLGTALTARQVDLLVASVPTGTPLIVALDGDPAGQKATRRAYDLLKERWAGPLLCAPLPSGADPASLLAERGPDHAARVLTTMTVPLAAAIIDQITTSLPLADIAAHDDIARRVGALRQVLPYLRDLADTDPTVGASAAMDFAVTVGLDPMTVFEAVYPPAPDDPQATTPRPERPAAISADTTGPAIDTPFPVLDQSRSVFRHPAREVYTSRQVLAAEDRLLAAATMPGPTVPHEAVTAAIAAAEHVLAPDQVDAIRDLAHSGTSLSLLIGPAGAGKTTTLKALVKAWGGSRGPVLGLALSANAAGVLSASTELEAENIAKWMYEAVGDGARQRLEYLVEITRRHNESQNPKARRTLARIHAEVTATHQKWQLKPGHLVIVDEAGLVGTLTLDRLRHEVARVGGKLLLVGDWMQLAAIEAGGAIRLLDESGHGTRLTSVWRFKNEWERKASVRIRTGDIRVATVYAEHGRIIEGTDHELREKMYANWSRDEAAGKTSLMMTVSTSDAADLAARARADRVTAGTVEAEGVTLHDGTTAGVGDRIVTRKNNRKLRFGTHWVRNGNLFAVLARAEDGSLRVRHLDSGRTVTLPAAYVAASVELGYATTVTRALGMTVDTGHSLVHDTMTREQLYAAATRGAESNLLYTPTFVPLDVDLERPAPLERKGHEVLASAIARQAAELSATQTLAAEQDKAASLHTLAGQLDYGRTVYSSVDLNLLLHRHLPADLAQVVIESEAYGALGHALAEAQRAGYRLETLLPAVVAQRELHSADDPAAVLYDRVIHTATRTVPAADGLPPWLPARSFGPDGEPGLPAYSQAMVRAIRNRVTNLTDATAASPPPWAATLGPVPNSPAAREKWRTLAGGIAAYRDLYQVDDLTPLGPRPQTAGRQAQAWTYLTSQLAGLTTERSQPTPSVPVPAVVPHGPTPTPPTPASSSQPSQDPNLVPEWDPEFATDADDPGPELN